MSPGCGDMKFLKNIIMKLPLVTCFIIASLHQSFSQSIFLKYNIGMATGEMYNLKKNMFTGNAQVGSEVRIYRGFLFQGSFAFESVRFSNTDIMNNNVFTTRTNIFITAAVKHLLFPSIKGNHFFYSLGISGGKALKDKREIFNQAAKTVVNKNLDGYNLAFLADLGYEFKVSEKVRFSISLLTQNDFYKKYDPKSDEIKLERILFSMGACYKLNSR